MFRHVRILVAAAALALCLGHGVNAGPSGSGHALAAGGGYSTLVQFCKANPGKYPIAGSSQGACVSLIASNGNSNASAPGYCNYVATTLGNGYGFVLEFYDLTTGDVGSLGPLNNQGACVTAITKNLVWPHQYHFVAFYP